MQYAAKFTLPNFSLKQMDFGNGRIAGVENYRAENWALAETNINFFFRLKPFLIDSGFDAINFMKSLDEYKYNGNCISGKPKRRVIFLLESHF